MINNTVVKILINKYMNQYKYKICLLSLVNTSKQR